MERVRPAAVLGLLLICVTSVLTQQDPDIDVYSFHINSTVKSRYATTVITSRVANRLTESKEIHFQVKIPKNAFISRFRMTMEGKTYDGVVKQKEEAQQQYSQAVSRGESAGIVSSVGRTLEDFKTSVTVSALSKVTFELTYEELLKRRLGKYELLINTQPTQPVADFKIDVYINESPGVSSLDIKGGLNTKDLANAVTTTRSGQEVWVNFYPTLEQQTKCDVCGPNGINGDLLIQYDVERPKPGEVKASKGYFVHYFAPSDVQRMPKNVVFIIDRSGSMRGRKIQQTQEAMLRILGDIDGEDLFGLIIFKKSQIEVWKSELVQATESQLEEAKAFIRQVQAGGGTDINAAVLKGVEMINNHPREGSASILILLTDGDPTSGETNLGRIQANVKEAIGGKFPLYCLGFGFDVKFEFLEKMARENNGEARRIYEASDADVQLKGFYEEVATPLLTDVQLNYIGVSNLTQTSFSHYYNGSEIVVAGQITDNNLETFNTEVLAISRNAKVTFQDSVFTNKDTDDDDDVPAQHEDFIQRLWAYLTVKQLLEKEVTLTGEEKEEVKTRALDLSLKYQFVTPLTSMVVTKPEGEKTQVAHKPKEGEQTDSLSQRTATSSQSTTAGRSSSSRTSNRRLSKRPLSRHRSPPRRGNFPTGDYDYSDTGFYFAISGYYDFPPRGSTDYSDYGTQYAVTTPVPTVRFLISSPHQPKPLCYDLPVGTKLRLLHNQTSDFSINGRLASNGFEQIIVRYKKAKYVLNLNSNEIIYTISNQPVQLNWKQEITRHEQEGVIVVVRENELDVTMATVRIIFIRHQTPGDTFIWPAVRQQPDDDSFQGILGKKTLQYEELSGSKVKIGDKETKATWTTATDYRLLSAPSVGCWLVPFRSVLKTGFKVPQL